jgi:hypothetical protein
MTGVEELGEPTRRVQNPYMLHVCTAAAETSECVPSHYSGAKVVVIS